MYLQEVQCRSRRSFVFWEDTREDSKMADKETVDDEATPAQDIVVTKYKMAGDMVNGEDVLTIFQST